MDTKMQSARIAWLDVARTLGIVLVVFGHLERGLMSAQILSSPIWQQIDFMIYTFHMPLFFYLSGMNVRSSRDKPGFFERRAKGIILPYIVFSLLQGGAQVVMAGHTNGNLSWQDLLLLPVHPIAPFWFLYVLLIYVALVSLFRPSWIFMLVAIVMTALSPLAQGYKFWPLFQVLYFFSFYMVGVLFQAPRLPGWCGPIAILVWAATCFVALKQGVPVDNYYALYMLPAAVGGSIGLIWISQRLEALQGLNRIGRNVIAIYVMHILAASGTRIILMKLGLDQAALHLIIGLAAGIVLPLVALWGMQKLRIAPLLGLPAR